MGPAIRGTRGFVNALAFALPAIVSANDADAKVEVGGVKFSAALPAATSELAAALQLTPGTEGEGALDDVRKRLEIELLARSRPASQLAAPRDRLEHRHAHDADVAPGNRYALTHLPGVGAEFSKNGRRLAVVAGSDFPAAYFSTWLGDDPGDAGLRDTLRNGLSARARN